MQGFVVADDAFVIMASPQTQVEGQPFVRFDAVCIGNGGAGFEPADDIPQRWGNPYDGPGVVGPGVVAPTGVTNVTDVNGVMGVTTMPCTWLGMTTNSSNATLA